MALIFKGGSLFLSREKGMNLSTYGLAFLEGVGLILSPCILPILPIVLSLGIGGPKSRPYGIIVGFVISFAALTLLSRQVVTSLGIDIEIIRYVSFALLFLFALVLISDTLSEKFTQMTSRFANLGEKVAQNQPSRSGFFGGLVLGAAIGFIWVPCAGPIMAAVIVQTVTQQTTWETVVTLVSFSTGTAVPMLFLVLMGRRIMGQVSYLKSYTYVIRKILGVIILISVLFTAWPMGVGPSSGSDTRANGSSSESKLINGLINGLPSPYPAPKIAGVESWINSAPLNLDQLKGKVVLVDFWTYSCINCVRTLPILTKWDETYRDKGLVIIGIHTPEFEFEKKLGNVQQAVKKHNTHYAVALDNNFKTWINFQNRYWPAHYLIDREGKVVYTHFGEGNYDITESNIRYLLGLTQPSNAEEAKTTSVNPLTPETYLGYDRAERFAKPTTMVPDRPFDYPSLNDIPLNEWSLEGKWVIEKERITAKGVNAKIKLHFNAKKVFLVLGSATGKPIEARIKINGQPAGKDSGEDVHQNKVIVTKDTLYELVSLDSFKDGLLEVQASDPALQAYAFTFGS